MPLSTFPSLSRYFPSLLMHTSGAADIHGALRVVVPLRRTSLTMLALALVMILSFAPTAPVGVMSSPALRALEARDVCNPNCTAWATVETLMWAMPTYTRTIVAGTVVYKVNRQAGTTATSTIFNELPPGVTLPPTNAAGTRVAIIDQWDNAANTATSIVVPYPTGMTVYPSEYQWQGVLPTVHDGRSACVTADERSLEPLSPQPTARFGAPDAFPEGGDAFGTDFAAIMRAGPLGADGAETPLPAAMQFCSFTVRRQGPQTMQSETLLFETRTDNDDAAAPTMAAAVDPGATQTATAVAVNNDTLATTTSATTTTDTVVASPSPSPTADTPTTESSSTASVTPLPALVNTTTPAADSTPTETATSTPEPPNTTITTTTSVATAPNDTTTPAAEDTTATTDAPPATSTILVLPTIQTLVASPEDIAAATNASLAPAINDTTVAATVESAAPTSDATTESLSPTASPTEEVTPTTTSDISTVPAVAAANETSLAANDTTTTAPVAGTTSPATTPADTTTTTAAASAASATETEQTQPAASVNASVAILVTDESTTAAVSPSPTSAAAAAAATAAVTTSATNATTPTTSPAVAAAGPTETPSAPSPSSSSTAPPSTVSPPPLTLGSSTFSPDSATRYTIAGMTLSAGGPPVTLTAPGGSATTRVALLTAPGGSATSVVVVAAASTGGRVSSSSSVFVLAPVTPTTAAGRTVGATNGTVTAAASTTPTLGGLVPTELLTWSAATRVGERSLVMCYAVALMCSVLVTHGFLGA